MAVRWSIQLFFNSATFDFRLYPDSKAVDAGKILKEAPDDFFGRKRPLGKVTDIGIYEQVAYRKELLTLPKPKAPTSLEYGSIGLLKFVNRSLTDEKDNDGIGGWSDQGPNCDMRNFPTGAQVFHNVLFTILSPKSCIVLRSRMRKPGNLPLKVEIPVNRKANVIYFLHSGAWCGRGTDLAAYIIHLADGSKVTIPLIGEVNMRDWSANNPDEPFPKEHPTTTKVAWTGENSTFPKVSVYMMEWVNTNPWIEIRSIEFISKNNGIPILLAITAGIEKKRD